jgi:phosphopantothenoylcysteine decarboxylase/phosphopantothenate--cysteine ligase
MPQLLNNIKIVVGVTGSIAAYKAADLIRRLQDSGAQVRVIMTTGACEFITPLTLQSLSGHPVAIELLDADQESAMGHIALARWADWILVAPASANSLARLAQGQADDLLTATVLASEAPLVVAPAMNNKMWQALTTQTNLTRLRSNGVYVLGPASGGQACGEMGEGRLLEPQDIVDEMTVLAIPKQLQNKKVVITAGPTYEAIDPVRFIGNRSSGKMGFAIAKAAQEAGAEVYIIAGPVSLATPTGVTRYDVESARQMFEKVMETSFDADIFIASAAVADYRPASQQSQKIKKDQQTNLTLELEATEDIVTAVAKQDKKPFVLGFAAETHAVNEYAQDKLQRKNLDMIAANKVGEGIGFQVDENALEVFWPKGQQSIPKMPKLQLARMLMKLIIEQYYAKSTT